MSNKKQTPPSFEEAMLQLETLVNHMENNTLSLEDSLETFEKGIHLTQICQKALSQAEQDIKILTSKQQEIGFEQS
jgi:exodeoxyribonuclease VII small subunit